MNTTTPDLCDAHPEVIFLSSDFKSFGKINKFYGEIVTVKCFEDNSKVKELVNTEGKNRVIVVDGGASKRHALLGDQLALAASKNGWAGLVINGRVRDVEELIQTDLGIYALGSCPRKTEKRDLGDVNVPIEINNVLIKPGQYIYVDQNGILLSSENYLGSK